MFSFIKLIGIPPQFVPLVQTQLFSLYKHKAKPKYIGQSKLWGEKYFLLEGVTDKYVETTLKDDGFSMEESNFFYKTVSKRADVILNMKDEIEILMKTEPTLYMISPRYLALPVWTASIMEKTTLDGKTDSTVYTICQTVYVAFCKKYAEMKEKTNEEVSMYIPK